MTKRKHDHLTAAIERARILRQKTLRDKLSNLDHQSKTYEIANKRDKLAFSLNQLRKHQSWWNYDDYIRYSLNEDLTKLQSGNIDPLANVFCYTDEFSSASESKLPILKVFNDDKDKKIGPVKESKSATTSRSVDKYDVVLPKINEKEEKIDDPNFDNLAKRFLSRKPFVLENEDILRIDNEVKILKKKWCSEEKNKLVECKNKFEELSKKFDYFSLSRQNENENEAETKHDIQKQKQKQINKSAIV